jgi:hypothetical protein
VGRLDVAISPIVVGRSGGSRTGFDVAGLRLWRSWNRFDVSNHPSIGLVGAQWMT